MSDSIEENKSPKMDLSKYLTDEQQAVIQQRAQLMIRCEQDPILQAAVRKLCRDGTPDGTPGYLYFFKMFACVYEPRNPGELRRLPFFPYPFQEEELKFLHESVEAGQGIVGEPKNILYVKSRDMGVTWLILTYFLWDWLFNGGSYLVGHRKQEEVDKIGDMATLFEKMRWQLRGLPVWMLPPGFDWRTDCKENMLRNPLGGEIVGESSNPEFGRGDRRKAILFDEFPVWENDLSAWKAAAGSTYVRIAVGTPKGMHNKFARLALREKGEEEVTVREAHWRLHPIKSRGLKLVHGRYTSPWYERETRRMNREDIASELDCNFNESTKAIVFHMYGAGHQKKELTPIQGLPIIRVWDPGRTFACLLMQIDSYGRVRALKEIWMVQAQIRSMAEAVLQECAKPRYEGFLFEDCGDPSGSYVGNSAQEDPEYTILSRDYGINVDWQFMGKLPTKIRIKTRVVGITEAMVKYCPSRDPDLDGPALQVDIEQCPTLHKALGGGYQYKLDGDGNILDQIKEVHPYEDVVDCLGMGVVYKQGAMIGNPYKDDYEDEDEAGQSSIQWSSGVSRC